ERTGAVGSVPAHIHHRAECFRSTAVGVVRTEDKERDGSGRGRSAGQRSRVKNIAAQHYGWGCNRRHRGGRGHHADGGGRIVVLLVVVRRRKDRRRVGVNRTDRCLGGNVTDERKIPGSARGEVCIVAG